MIIHEYGDRSLPHILLMLYPGIVFALIPAVLVGLPIMVIR